MQRKKRVDICKVCGGRLVVDGAEQVCTTCGATATLANTQPTWEERQRCTPTSTLGSVLKGSNGDHKLDLLLKKANAIGFDQTAHKCVQLVKQICDAGNVPSYVERQAADIASKVSEVKPASTPVIAAYSVVYASRLAGYNGLHTKKLLTIVSDMGHRISWHSIVQLALAHPLPAKSINMPSCIDMTISRLRTSSTGTPDSDAGYWQELLRTANKVSDVALPFREGADPASIASLCVYTAEVLLSSRDGRKKRLSQEEVTGALGMTVYAMRDLFTKMFCLKREELEALVAPMIEVPAR